MDENIFCRILLVDDDEDDYMITKDLLNDVVGITFELEWISNYENALEAIAGNDHDIYLFDYRLGPQTGLDLINDTLSSGNKTPIILLTGQGDHEIDIQAMKAGASDYLIKGEISAALLGRSIRYALERQRAEKKLLKEKEHTQKYLNVAEAIMIVLDTEQKITLINRKGCEILGYSEDEVIGKNWFNTFLPEEVRSEVADVFNSLIAGKIAPIKYYENTVLTKSGEERLIAWHNNVTRDDKDRITGIITSGQDITEKKKVEEQLLRTRKLESTAILAGGIAHDFNNLLSIICGNIDMALEEIEPYNSATILLENAFKASIKGRDLTAKFLTFAKGGSPVKKMVSTGKLIKESVQLVMSGSNIEYNLDIPQDLWQINVDSSQVAQAIYNVLLNAKEAMPRGGLLKIIASNMEKEKMAAKKPMSVATGKFVEISFIDNGSGISDEALPNIFDPYFSTKEKGDQKGMGLGLTIVNSIINKHNGFINVASDPGVGTTLNLYLPAFMEELPQEIKSTNKSGSCSYKVLFMDDEDLMRELAKEIFARLGHEVVLAKRGEEAIKFYNDAKNEGKPFDAVILDLTIKGGMGGETTFLKLREISPDIKAIVASGYSNVESTVLSNYQKHGFKAVILKPFIKNDIKNILEKVISG